MEANNSQVGGQTPPKKRDLSVRYGGQNSKPSKYADDVIPPINVKHPIFTLVAALGFGFLYAELLFFVLSYYNNLALLDNTLYFVLIVGFFILSSALFYGSFILPHIFTRRKFDLYSPIVFLVNQLTIAAGLILATTVLGLALAMYLISQSRADGAAAFAEVLRSFSLYAVVLIVLFHGLVVFVRYVRYLYERDMHESYKIVSFLGGTAGIVMVVTLYLLQFDFGRMAGTTANAGGLSLHLTVRDLVLLFLTFFSIGWTATGIADH